MRGGKRRREVAVEVEVAPGEKEEGGMRERRRGGRH